MKAFLDRTFVTGNGNDGFLGERGTGTVKFKTTEGVERQARMMFLTGRKVDEPEARDASQDEQKKEKERLQTCTEGRKRPPPPPPVQRPGQAGRGGAPARRPRVLRPVDRQPRLEPAVRPRTGDAAGPDAFGQPAQPPRPARLAGPRHHPARLRPPPADPRPGPEPRLCPRQPLGRRRSRPGRRCSPWPSSDPSRRCNWPARSGWRPPTRPTCPADLKPAELEKRIASWKTVVDRWLDSRNPQRATPRSAWPRRSSSATARRSRKISWPTAMAAWSAA